MSEGTQIDDDAPPAPPEPALEPEADADAAAGRRRRLGWWVLIALLAGAVVAGGSLAASSYSSLDRTRRDRNEVEATAGRFAAALLSFDYSNLKQAKESVLRDATGSFRREYEEAFEKGLDVLLKESKARSSATVTDVFVGSIDSGTARAIAVVDAAADGVAGRRSSVASYIQLDLVKVNGRWKVDGVTNLNFGQQAAPDAQR